MVGLSACQKNGDEPKNDEDCHKMWTVKSSTPYQVKRDADRVDFEVQNVTDNRFMLYQQAPKFLHAGLGFDVKIRLRDILVTGTPSSVVGERVSLFVGYENDDEIEPYAGVAISRGDMDFLLPDGAERRAFFSPIGDYLNYEIHFNKNPYGHIVVRVTNLLTNEYRDQLINKHTETSKPYFCIMASSTLTSRFGNIDKLTFSFEKFEFISIDPGFSNDMFQCDFVPAGD